MGRRLVERKPCETCGQVVETLADGAQLGHAETCGAAVADRVEPEGDDRLDSPEAP